MALTRSEHAVSEVRGRYGGVELGAHAGQVVGERIDLRVFLQHWRHLFAIDEPHPQRRGERRRSLQAFDPGGAAVHKIYLEPDGNARTWDALVAERAVIAPLVIEPAAARRPEQADDGAALGAVAWLVARCADRVLVLRAGVALADGPPGRVLSSALLSRAFDIPVEVERTPRGALVVQPIADGAVNDTG